MAGGPRDWRVYHPHPFEGAGSLTDLDPTEAHHVTKVLRLRAGESLSLFDGQGTEWLGTLVRCDRQGVSVRLNEQRSDRVDPELEVFLYQGLCRPDRMEWAIQKATEVGVAAVHPVRSERADPAPLSPTRLLRWQRIAIEAAKQCGRRRVPPVRQLDGVPDTAGPDSPGFLLDTARSAPPLGEVLARPRPERVLLAAGPESGFGERERVEWLDRGWQPVSLGPRTLRAETAAVVALAILLNGWSDLGSRD